jgi:hypothetical protein
MPASESYWWNRFSDVSHLPLLQKYIETVRRCIPLCGADGRALHLHTVPSLKVFCRSYGVSLGDASLKQEILRLIDEERSIRANAYA